MLTRKIQKALFLAVLLSVIACEPAVTQNGANATPMPSSNNPIGTNEPSATPSSATATPTWSPIITVSAIEAMVSSPNYLVGCKSLSKTLLTEQTSYRGIVPGKSTYADVTNLLGDPNDKAYLGNQWLYDGVSVLFDGGKHVVEVIHVFAGAVYDQMAIPLLDIIGKYGCPEIIYAYDEGEEKSGYFTVTTFAYPTLGVEFRIRGYPVILSSKPDEIFIFIGESLSDYLLDRKQLLEDSEATVVLPWDEAIAK